MIAQLGAVRALRERFTREIWPVIQDHGRAMLWLRRFRGERLDEALGELAALCWRDYLRQPNSRKVGGRMVSVRVRKVVCGERLCAQGRHSHCIMTKTRKTVKNHWRRRSWDQEELSERFYVKQAA